MAEPRPVNGSDDAGGDPPDLGRWLARWAERADPADLPLPGDEAHVVLGAVLDFVGGDGDEVPERIGRAWGRAHRSVGVLVRRLSALREAFAVGGVDDAPRMHRALDRVTADATEEVMRRLEHASRTDPLTGVGNRRAFEETLQASLSAATRQGHEITVVEVDLDGLKRLNDERGHAAGDAALLALVRGFYAALRDEDTVFRVGGDEFMILLPFTSAEDAAVLMERVAAGGAPPFTWGASGFPGDATEAVALVAAADQDLYRRRHVRRAPPRAGRVAGALGLPSDTRWLRLAWIPAAAILLVSMVATLTAGPAQRSATSAGPRHVVTKPGTGRATAPSVAAGSGITPAGTAATGASVVPAALVGSVVSSTAPAVAGPVPSSGAPAGGSSPSRNASAPSGGGLLGLVGILTSAIPVVGGSNGLVGSVTQLLTGSPTAAAATSAPAASTGTVGSVLSSLVS